MSVAADDLVNELEARLRPLEVELARAWWDASTQSSEEADRRRIDADVARRAMLADSSAFDAICDAQARSDLTPSTRRQLEVLHDLCTPHQLPEDMRRRLVELETSVDSTFNSFRGELDGQRVEDNALLEILRTSNDSELRRRAWEASKQIGAEVGERVRELARLRNEAAQLLGYRDHFALALATGEMDEARLFSTLDEVDRVTSGPFTEWKRRLDDALAQRFGCAPDDLRPWNLDEPFFQDPPASGAVDLDSFFRDRDLEALTTRTFEGLGLDIEPVLQRSDLYSRAGKSQHAFCIDIDREGDVRVLCNVEPNERWMDTMLHEFGHGIYDREIDHDVPWLVRQAAHPLTTEGVAMLFGRLVREPDWLATIGGLAPGTLSDLLPRLDEARRAALLTFARWVLVVTHFERQLYADPDGDLDARWWDLVEQYQQVRRPEGQRHDDWASKIHLAVVPVYYQNYLYGEMVASQLTTSILERAGGFVDREAAGRYLAHDFFRPGGSLRWDELMEQATGEPLTAKHLARQITS